MKKIWKFMGVAALAAALPLVIRTDPTTRERSYDALLYQVRTRPNPTTGKTEVTAVSIIPNRIARRYPEKDWFEDDEGIWLSAPSADLTESEEGGPF